MWNITAFKYNKVSDEVPDPYIGPSAKIIKDCFLQDFQSKEPLYTYHMPQISAEWISIDHTFKVAANTGIQRKIDSKWEKQYDSLLCILNEQGCVLAWQLSKGTAFDKVQDLLGGLKARLDQQEKTLTEYYFLDNYCAWRRKIQSIFGQTLQVKLDIFHAVQRVTMKLSKRHPFHYSCIQAFSLVFRQEQDRGEKRKFALPDPETMEKQLDSFIESWKDKIFDGTPVLTSEAIGELEKLRKHITKGCISHIPPGCGTERNEDLHKCLRKAAAKIRLRPRPHYAG